MQAPSKKIYIKSVEELMKKRFYIFGCEIHMPYEEFKKMPRELNISLIYQMNSFETEK